MAKHIYQILSTDEMDDTVVSFFASQERDLHSHELNKERFAAILLEAPAGSFRTRIEHLLAETNVRIAEIEAIIKATQPQLPVGKRLEDAAARTKGK